MYQKYKEKYTLKERINKCNTSLRLTHYSCCPIILEKASDCTLNPDQVVNLHSEYLLPHDYTLKSFYFHISNKIIGLEDKIDYFSLYVNDCYCITPYLQSQYPTIKELSKTFVDKDDGFLYITYTNTRDAENYYQEEHLKKGMQ